MCREKGSLRQFSRRGQSGLTLIEIIVALAIMGILALSFLNVFSSGVVTIFNMGHKTRALAEAQGYIDAIYRSGEVTDASIGAILVSGYQKKANMTALLNDAYNGTRIRYSVETLNVLGQINDKVTVLVFYRNGAEYVVLSTIVP